MKKCKIVAIILAMVMALSIFASCNLFGNKVTSITIKEGTIPTSAVEGETLDLSQIKVEVQVDKGKATEVSLDKSMLSQEDVDKLSTAGTHTITVTHEGQTCTFTITVAKKEIVVAETDLPKDVYVDAIATVYAYSKMIYDEKKIAENDHWRWCYSYCLDEVSQEEEILDIVKKLCDKAGITETEIDALVEVTREGLIIAQDYTDIDDYKEGLEFWCKETTINAVKQVLNKLTSAVPVEKLSVLADEALNFFMHDEEYANMPVENNAYVINGVEYRYEDFEAAAATANVTAEYKKAWNTIMSTKDSLLSQTINKENCSIVIQTFFAVLNTLKNLDTQKVCGLIEYFNSFEETGFDFEGLASGEISYRDTIKQVNFLGEIILSLYDGISGVAITDIFNANLLNSLPQIVTGGASIANVWAYLQGISLAEINSGAVIKLIANLMKDITATNASDIYLDIQDISAAKDEEAAKSKIGILAVRVANILNNSYNKLTNEEKEGIKNLLNSAEQVARTITCNEAIEVDTFINIYKECIKYTADTVTTQDATKIGEDLSNEVTSIVEFDGVDRLFVSIKNGQYRPIVKQNATKTELFEAINEKYSFYYVDIEEQRTEFVELQESMITAFDTSKTSQQSVTVQYNGVSCTVTVYVYNAQTFDNLTSIANESNGNFVYQSYVGEELNPSVIISHNRIARDYATVFVDSQGYAIKLKKVSSCSLIYDTTTVGEKVGFMVFDLDELGEFAIPFKYVVYAEYEDRAIMIKYTDRTVVQGEELDGVWVTSSSTWGVNRGYRSLMPRMVSGYDKTKLGEQEVTITYKGATCKAKVTVISKAEAQKITSICSTQRARVAQNQTLDESNVSLSVRFAYDDYSEYVNLDELNEFFDELGLTNYTYSLSTLDTSTAGDKYIILTIKDGDKTVTTALIWVEVVNVVNGLLLEPDEAGTGWQVAEVFSAIDTNLVIPSSYLGKPITKIANNAFCFADVSTIIIPSTVKSIGRRAFYACENLRSVTFADNSQLTSIEESAFHYCSALSEITIPAGVTHIGGGAFYPCYNLTAVTFENPVGWKAGTDSVDLTDPSSNVYYLAGSYCYVDWNRE